MSSLLFLVGWLCARAFFPSSSMVFCFPFGQQYSDDNSENIKFLVSHIYSVHSFAISLSMSFSHSFFLSLSLLVSLDLYMCFMLSYCVTISKPKMVSASRFNPQWHAWDFAKPAQKWQNEHTHTLLHPFVRSLAS